MGLGKFNYTNRKSEGVKLGAIVARDLRKKASSIAAKDDGKYETAPIELQLSGRKLTDEGLEQVVDGLIDAVLQTWSNGIPCFALEELDLRDNLLTTCSLSHLRRIIEISPRLKDLDLSDNLISIKTHYDCQAWREFLDSFRMVSGMRRLALYQNDLSGPKAFEIYAQIYAKHSRVEPQAWLRRQSISDNASDSTTSMILGRHSNCSSTRVPTLVYPGGLRSIPYVILSETKLDDSGSLWLSYTIEEHYKPDQLLEPLKPGPIASMLNAYDEDSMLQGLIYSLNESLTTNGRRVLAAAETTRERIERHVHDITQNTVQPGNSVVSDNVDSLTTGSRDRSSSESDDWMSRRPSAYSVDLDGLRRKLQRTTLEELGCGQIELWSACLRTIVLARLFLSRPVKKDMSSKISIQDKWLGPRTSSLSSRLAAFKFPPRSAIDQALMKDQTKTPNAVQDLAGRDSSRACQLPQDIWFQIIKMSADPHSALSVDQTNKTLAYGADLKTLSSEREWHSKAVSHQIWLVLEKTDCLTYKMTG